MENKGTNGIFLLGLLFVALKLTNYIDWSWWYITMPFWLGITVLIVILGIVKGLKLILKDKTKIPSSSPRKSKFQERLNKAIEASKKESKK